MTWHPRTWPPPVVGIVFLALILAGAWADGQAFAAECSNVQSPELSVSCPPFPGPATPTVGTLLYLWIGLGAAVAVVIGLLVIVAVSDRLAQERER